MQFKRILPENLYILAYCLKIITSKYYMKGDSMPRKKFFAIYSVDTLPVFYYVRYIVHITSSYIFST